MTTGVRACVAVLCVMLAGCASENEIRPGVHFRGPSMAIDSDGDHHIVVLTAPSPGYSFEFDRSDAADGPTRLLVTIRRPDPGSLRPQVLVQQRVLTDVRSGLAVEVFARMLDHDQRDGRPWDLAWPRPAGG